MLSLLLHPPGLNKASWEQWNLEWRVARLLSSRSRSAFLHSPDGRSPSCLTQTRMSETAVGGRSLFLACRRDQKVHQIHLRSIGQLTRRWNLLETRPATAMKMCYTLHIYFNTSVYWESRLWPWSLNWPFAVIDTLNRLSSLLGSQQINMCWSSVKSATMIYNWFGNATRRSL